jgi:methionine sulfoxide reductase heme-binding subunit
MDARRARRLWKGTTLLLGTIPALAVAVRFATGALGANPIAEAMNRLGYWALFFLVLSLVCTPLQILFGWTRPLIVRKALGLLAFFYACLHLGTYVVLDQFFAWEEIWRDIARRKFITVGFAAFLLLVPLAVTSTSRMVKRLGFPRWKRLHRLVYLAAALGVVHFVWREKADLLEPLVFGGALAGLLLVRVVAFLRGRGGQGVRSAPS